MLTTDSLKKIDREIAKYPSERKQSAVISALIIAQDEKGWLSSEVMDYVAKYLGMPPVAVYEVASFYTMYNLQKTGRFKIHTSMDPLQSCAIGTVQVLGVDTGKAVATLWDKWRIIATPINHAEYTGIRVTPNVYTTLEEIDTFGDAMERVAEGGTA